MSLKSRFRLPAPLPEVPDHLRRALLTGAGAVLLVSSIDVAASTAPLASARAPEEGGADRLRVDALTGVDLDKAGYIDATVFDELAKSGLTMMQTTVGTSGGGADTPAYTYDAALAEIVKWHGNFARHRDRLIHVRRGEDILQAWREGKLGVMLGFQNGTHLNHDIRNLQFFYDLGVRNIQLTYNQLNDLGAGCTEPIDPGLSDFGMQVVARMNEIGMAVDLSHCGVRTTLEAIEVSKKPVLFTHSNCRTLNDNPRCKSDEEIRKLAAKGGVMGMTTIDYFVTSKASATLDDFISHIEHAVNLVGVEHVGIGSDTPPVGGILQYYGSESAFLEDRKNYANFKPSPGERWPLAVQALDVTEKLLIIERQLAQRGFSNPDIDKVMGGNFQRVYREVLG